MSGLKSATSSCKRSPGLTLTKNSTIECTIDDLQEGVVVISFSHQDRLFQGVLLELNRERGTPAGVPFPKDYFSGSCTKPEALDTSQVPPLNQRHTYFQDVHHGNQHRSLRRVIKPPARFKNSRMSLRPVHRPVLCAKCGIRCEDKSNSQGNSDKDTPPEPSTTNATSSPTSVKKNNGIHRKKTHAKALGNKSETLLGRTSSSSKGSSRDTLSPVLQEDPNDYCYESVGSSGIVENAWKRPFSKPLKSQTKPSSGKTLNKQENLSPTFNGRNKSPPPPVLVPATYGSSLAVESSYCDKPPLLGLSSDKAKKRLNLGQLSSNSNVEGSQEPSTTIFRVTKPSADVTKLSDEQSKMNNLKLCISKISCGNKRKLENVVLKRNQSTPNLLCVTKMPGESDSQSQSTGLNSNSKIKIKRRITKTPLRFREPETEDKSLSPTESDYLRIFPTSDEDSKEKVNEENGESNQMGILNRTASDSKNESLNKISPVLTCSSSSTTSTSSNNSNNCNFPEPVKTPVLKILFDSKGSGMVVQIPSKPTSQSPSLNGSELAESKAARKAMKKAKREARKKHVSEPTKNALPQLTPHPVLSYADNQSSATLPPIRLTELNSCSNNDLQQPLDSNDWCSMSSDVEISPLGTKKRKKVKRRRKDKKSFRVRNEDSPEESTSSAIPTPSPPLVDHDEAVSSSTTGPSIKFDKFGSGQYVFASHCSDNKDFESKEHSEAQERVLLSLKRLDTNAYTTVSKEVDQVPTSTNKASEVINDDVSSDGPVTLNIGETCSAAESTDFYVHEKSNQIFRKGDVVWGQNIDNESGWWPAKIQDIITKDSKPTKAEVSWYKLKLNSIISFDDIFPFKKLFQNMYVTTRRKDCYQQAVDEALSEAHFMNQEDLHID